MFIFNTNKPDNSPTLRIGNTVPEGDVNLAYVVTKSLDPATNVQVVDCAGASIDNLSRFLQLNAIAVSDLNGQLHYLNDNSIDQTPIPISDLVITSRFYDGKLDVSDALYYEYSPSSNVGEMPGLSGLYTGDSITVTNDDGSTLDPSNLCQIYLTPTSTSGVYTAIIYTSFNTTTTQTFLVRYNQVSGSTIIPGHVETLNAAPLYTNQLMSDVLSAEQDTPIYAITDAANGYDVFVPAVAEYDPRTWQYFSWQLTGKDSDNNIYTTGPIADRMLPLTSVLDIETGDYADCSRILTIGGLDVAGLEALLPPGLDNYELLSSVPAVAVSINGDMAEAMASISSPVWMPVTTDMYVDQGIDYCCTVFPKRNVSSLSWDWKATGSGTVSNAATIGDGNFTSIINGVTNVIPATNVGNITVYNIPGRSASIHTDVGVLLTNQADSNQADFNNVLCLDTNSNVNISMAEGMPAASATISFAVNVTSAVTIDLGFSHSNQLTISLNGVQQYQSLTDNASIVNLTFQPGWNDLEFDYLDTDLTSVSQCVMIDTAPIRCDNSYIYLNEPLTTYLTTAGATYKINSQMPTVSSWSTTLSGTASATYSGSVWVTSLLDSNNDPITTLPTSPAGAPSNLDGFSWTGVTWSNQDVVMVISSNAIVTTVSISDSQNVALPYTFKGQFYKSDGIVSISGIDTIKNLCGITDDMTTGLYLEIVSGDAYGNNTTPNANFRWVNNGIWMVDADGNNIVQWVDIEETGQLIGWTNIQSMLGAPIFAIECTPASASYEQVFVTVPEVADPNLDNWYMAVQNGVFESTITLPPGNYEACPELINYQDKSVTLHYAVPEYAWQPFNPQIPYLTVIDGDAAWIDEHTLQLPNIPLSSVSLLTLNAGSPNSIILTVADINNATGMVTVAETLHDTDNISANYIYSTSSYEYRGYTAFGQFWHLDLNPSPGHQMFASVHNTPVGTSYAIPGDFPSLNASVGQDVPTSNLLYLCIYVYLRPMAAVYNGVLIPGSSHPTTVMHTTEASYFDPTSVFYDPTVILLARVYVHPSSSQSDITVVDTRVRGGGLKAGYTDNNLWDIGLLNGTAYPENGIILARFPSSILTQNGGQFTEADVTAAVNRHLAYGVAAIIEYFDD
jgi:hypothetical protein